MAFPRIWTETLDKLRAAGGDDAVIAGGAVRDFLLGREVKDIDVFLSSRGRERDREIVLAAFPDAIGLEHLGEYSPQFAELASIWTVNPTLTREDGLFFLGDPQDYVPLQIIFLDMGGDTMTAIYAITRIDFGLCRVAFDGRGIVHDGSFSTDLLNQTMTVRRPMSSANLERSKRRFVRLSAKYPSYTYREGITPL